MKVYFCLLMLINSFAGFAQQTELAKDENGKYLYYEVVEVSGISADNLIGRAKSFIDSQKMKELSKQDTSLTAAGKFIINKSLSAISHPAGEISYVFTAEVRNNKYRFWLTDFTFVPFARDRYGNFVATSSIAVPLEESPGKLNAPEWKNNIEATAVQAKKLADLFKSTMKNDLQETKKQSPVSKKW